MPYGYITKLHKNVERTHVRYNNRYGIAIAADVYTAKDLEEELGVTLFERGSRRIKLTEEGVILRRRAKEMVRLMQITENT